MKYLYRSYLIFLFTYVFTSSAMDPVVSSDMVFIKTSDGITNPIDRWKINEIKVLLVLLEHHKGSFNRSNPVIADMITSQELHVLNKALDSISIGTFDTFYTDLEQEDRKKLKQGQTLLSINGKIRTLIKVANRMQAHGISAFCLSHFMPSDEQNKLFVQDLINQVLTMLPMSKTVLSGHPAGLRIAQFSPDGTKVVSGSIAYNQNDPKNLILWDISDPKKITHQFLNGHMHSVKSVAFSPDSKYIVSASDGDHDNLILWDINNPQAITHQVLPGHSEKVRSVAFSADGRKIASSGDGDHNNLMLWDISNPHLPTCQILNAHQEGVTLVAFSPDGKKMISASSDLQNNFLLWDISNPQSISHQPLMGHQSIVYAAMFSPDSNKIVAGILGSQNNLILWDISNSQAITHQVLNGHPSVIAAVAFNFDGSKIVSGSWGNHHNLILWDISNVQTIAHQMLNGHPNNIVTVAFNPSGDKIVSGCSSEGLNNLILWDISNPNLITHEVLPGHPHTVRSVAFSPDGRKIISASLGIQDNLILYHLISDEEEHYLRKCTFTQAQFIYQICLAFKRGFAIKIESPYAKEVFNSLPMIIQNFLKNKLLKKCINTSVGQTKQGDCIIL